MIPERCRGARPDSVEGAIRCRSLSGVGARDGCRAPFVGGGVRCAG